MLHSIQKEDSPLLTLQLDHLRPIASPPPEDSPLSTLHLDHLKPIPSTSKNCKYIFTIVDTFTKYMELFPAKTTTADETLQKLHIITDMFGNPERLITDEESSINNSCKYSESKRQHSICYGEDRYT